MSLDIDSADVVRVILQFLNENGLTRTLHTLQEESGVTLNAVESLDRFVEDVQAGRWDIVLGVAGNAALPEPLLHMLYEQVVVEMCELKEFKVARRLLREAAAMQSLKLTTPEHYARLEHLISREVSDPSELYDGSTKDKRRAILAQGMWKELDRVPASRLLGLIGMASKWQHQQNLLPPGKRFDIFKGAAAAELEQNDECVAQITSRIKFGTKNHVECAAFSPDGQLLITGSIDGIIEIWDPSTGALKVDLDYQAKDEFMLHENAVLALAVSRDSEVLASASQEGQIKAWRIQTGACVRKFDKAHDNAITCMQFSRDSLHLLTGSFDTTARIHGLKSGKTLKEFRGHPSYVTSATYSSDNSRVLTGCVDGKVRFFDGRSANIILTFSPPAPLHGNQLTPPGIVGVVLNRQTKGADSFFVGTRSNAIHLINQGGQVVRSFSSGKKEGGGFVAITASPRGEWLYGVAEDNTLYCFSSKSGKLENLIDVHTKDALGLAHHPSASSLVSWGLDGVVNIIQP